MALKQQTSTKRQCSCLCKEVPRAPSVIGYIEDEVFFSFLPKTKIERLPSSSIFSLCLWYKPWPWTRFVNLVEPVHVLCSVAAGTRILFPPYSPVVTPPSSLLLTLKLPVLLGPKQTPVPGGLMGANGCPFFWETDPWMKACGEMFTMW